MDDQDDSERAALNQQLKNISRELTNDYEKFHGKIFGTVKSSFRNEEVDALWRMVRSFILLFLLRWISALFYRLQFQFFLNLSFGALFITLIRLGCPGFEL